MFYAQEMFMGKAKDFLHLWFLQDNNSCSGELQRKARVTSTSTHWCVGDKMFAVRKMHLNDMNQFALFLRFHRTNQQVNQTLSFFSVFTKSTQGLKKKSRHHEFPHQFCKLSVLISKDSMNWFFLSGYFSLSIDLFHTFHTIWETLWTSSSYLPPTAARAPKPVDDDSIKGSKIDVC